VSLIDHHNPLPLYEQIRQHLEKRIIDRIYDLGSLLPSEHELAEEFGVTRLTVRQATDVLKRKGYLESRRGQGTRITAPPIEQDLRRFYSFGRRYQDPDRQLSTKLIELKTSQELPDQEKEHTSDLGFGYSIMRLRLLDGRPLALEKSWIPETQAPKIESFGLENQSLYGLLEEEFGIKIGRAQEFLEPIIIRNPEAQHLDLSAGQPVLKTHRMTYDAENQLIEIRTTLVRPDRVRFRSDLSL
jgi:GntR family transcriptional regulator